AASLARIKCLGPRYRAISTGRTPAAIENRTPAWTRFVARRPRYLQTVHIRGEQMQNDESTPSPLASAFRDALVRTMRVAGEDEAGEPAGISRTELEERTGVSRKAIGGYCSGQGDGAKLETIERLAKGLGVPPAFLLMRREDWISL